MPPLVILVCGSRHQRTWHGYRPVLAQVSDTVGAGPGRFGRRWDFEGGTCAKERQGRLPVLCSYKAKARRRAIKAHEIGGGVLCPVIEGGKSTGERVGEPGSGLCVLFLLRKPKMLFVRGRVRLYALRYACNACTRLAAQGGFWVHISPNIQVIGCIPGDAYWESAIGACRHVRIRCVPGIRREYVT